MQATSVTVGSSTVSQWIPTNAAQNPTGIALACSLASGASLTYKVQYTPDNPQETVPVIISRSTTTATVTLPSHGLVAGDSVCVEGAGSPFDGTYAVASVVDANSFTYTVLDSGSTGTQNARLVKMRVFDHSSITGKTANSDGNFAFPVRAVRLNVTSYTGGSVTLTVNQGA